MAPIFQSCRLVAAAVAAFLAVTAFSARAEERTHTEFLLFPSVKFIQRGGLGPASAAMDRNETDASADFFVTSSYRDFRLLGEFLYADEEAEMERLQLGWAFRPAHTAWFGRYHNPIGYWHSQYHHGSYLQTSISHPGILAFDHDGGPLPTHSTGVLVEGAHAGQASGLRYALALGTSPELEEHLHAVDVLNPGKGTHKSNIAFRLSWLPEAYGPNEVGVFAAYARIPSRLAAVEEVRQRVLGVFANWKQGPRRLIASVFHVSDRLGRPAAGTDSGSFTNAYLQGEAGWGDDLRLFARVEGTGGGAGDAYLAYFPMYIKARSLAGVRYDLPHKQALTLELAGIHRQNDRFNMIMLQWSAVWP